MMIGSISTLIASAAARPDFSTPSDRIDRRVDEQARHDRRQRRHGLDDGAHEAREAAGNLVEEHGASVMPSGTVIASAMPISHRVPAMACVMPPTVSGCSGPAFDMSWVKKFRCGSAVRPRQKVYAMTNTRAASMTEAQAVDD